jgi:hypothetical protein
MAHDVAITERELALLRRKFAAERRAHGVEIDQVELLWYFGAWHLRQGNRRSATAAHLRLARLGGDTRVRALLAALVGGVWPGVQQLRDSLGERRLSPEWRAEAESWISELRDRAPVGDGALTDRRG